MGTEEHGAAMCQGGDLIRCGPGRASMQGQQNGAATRDVDPAMPLDLEPAAMTLSRPVTAKKAGVEAMRSPNGPVKILFFSANSDGRYQLAVDEEYRAIEQRIRLARNRD